MDVVVAPASGPDAPPPLMATYSNTTGFGSPPSDGALDLQWDQTYLRINYIVRNLAGPVPLQLHHSHSYQHLYAGPAAHDDAMSETSSERRRRLEAQDPAPPTAAARTGHQPTARSQGHHNSPAGLTGDSPTLGYPMNYPGTAVGGHAAGRQRASTRAWPNFSPERAAELSARVSVWTEEVSAQGEEAYCACSAPWAAARLRPPPEGAGDEGCSSATARGLLPAALVAGSAGGSSALASPAANTTGPGTGLCKVCGRPLDPAGNMATGTRSDSTYPQDNHSQNPGSCHDNDTDRGENGTGGATKKAFSRMQKVLHRFKRRGRTQRDLQDLINENNGVAPSNNDGNHDDNGGTKAVGGDKSAAPSGQGQDQRPRAATATTAAPVGSSVTLMYRTGAPGNGSPAATSQQPQNQQPGPGAPAGQGDNAVASGQAVESPESSAAGSSRRARDSAARLERARLLLERLNGHPLPHPPPPTAPPSDPPPPPPSGGSKEKKRK